MPKERRPIPQSVADQIMAANRHTCCICHKPFRHVQIHHIDGNPSNNDPMNLIVACLDCHSAVSSDQGFGRKYTPGELRIYKSQWEERCKLEDTKKVIINRFFLISDKHPIFKDPRLFNNFMTNVSTGVTVQQVYQSVEASSDIVFESTGNKSLADDFRKFILKREDNSQNGP